MLEIKSLRERHSHVYSSPGIVKALASGRLRCTGIE